MKKVLSISLIIGLYISQLSCDSILFIQYKVINCTGKKVELVITGYPVLQNSSYISIVTDTVIVLKKGESVIVSNSPSKIGGWGGSVQLFKDSPGRKNFTIKEGNFIYEVDASNKYWVYSPRLSTFRLTKRRIKKTNNISTL